MPAALAPLALEVAAPENATPWMVTVPGAFTTRMPMASGTGRVWFR